MKLPEVITTDRLSIRPFQEGDLEPYLAFMTDSRATRYLLLSTEQKTEAGATELLYAVIASYASDDPIFAYAIELPDQGCIGSCGISPVASGVYECYYGLLPRYWGQGYATEAAQALIDYCFSHYSIDEIRAYMSPEHWASAAVAERVGMTLLGLQDHPWSGIRGKVYSICRTR